MFPIRQACWLTLLSLGLLAGCGQKGPLYLEGHEPPSEKKAMAARQDAQKRRAEEDAAIPPQIIPSSPN